MYRCRNGKYDYVIGRILRMALIAVLALAMSLSGITSSFYAYAGEGSQEAEAAAPAAEAPAEAEDTVVNESPEQTEEPAEKEEPAQEEVPAQTEETPAEAEPAKTEENSDEEKPVEAAGPEVKEESVEKEEPAETEKNVNVAAPKASAVLKSSAPAALTAPAAPEGEARIGDKTYETVQDAVAEAVSGDIITIIKDIALQATLEIKDKDISFTDDGNARVIRNAEGASAPLFTVRKGATLTLDGSSVENLKLQGGKNSTSRTATALLIEGVANVKKVLIDGGVISNASLSGAIYVKRDGLLNMSGGVVENTVINSGGSGTAAVVVDEKAHFEMSGGEIRNNINKTGGISNGGGVVLYAWGSPQSTMNMTGGKIIGNESENGGGIYMTGSAKLNMTGGSVDGNKARNIGGGICVSGINGISGQNSEFIFNGGSISNNRARTAGGIYVNTDTAYLKKGYIEGNRASMLGGGVYVSIAPRVLHVEKAVITENESYIGGGLWACPTGNIHLKVTDGVAVYNNSARDAGDDVVNISRNSIYASTLTIPDRMLGGGAIKWYTDGSLLYSDYGFARSGSVRFDEENPGEELHFENQYGAVALKAVTTDAAITRANEEATLFIRNNYGWRGGGIGTNGDLTLANMDYKDWKLVAEKKWEDIEDTDDKEVKVYLKIGDRILDYITLNKDNGWKGEFTGLPDPSTLTDQNVTIVEGEMIVDENGNEVFVETSQYTVRYERVVMDDDSVIYVKVINSPLPPEEEIVIPPPEIPEENEVRGAYVDERIQSAEEPVVKAAVKEVTETSKGVPTGDSSEVYVYMMILLFAGAVMAAMTARRHRSE